MNMRYAKRSEDTEQINVVSWAGWNMNRYPELKWLFHVPNGGSRNKQEAVKFKQMGVKAGVSDLCLPYPKGSYCGLFVEMKFGNNRQQDTQKEFLADMAAAGHFVATCYSAEEAIKVIEECGCRDFYIAKITQNDATGYVAGTPVKLARAIKAKVDEKWTSEKIYSDDGTEEVINSYEGTEVELEVNALAPQDRQILFGQLYENGFLIKTADDKAPEVAVGWRERKLNGKYDFKWLYAGKFAEGISEEASTKEGKLSPTTKSIKGSFYERSLDNAYEISVDESNLVKENTKAAEAIKSWFSKVQEKNDAAA